MNIERFPIYVDKKKIRKKSKTVSMGAPSNTGLKGALQIS